MLSEATMKFFDTKDNLKSKKHGKDNLQILHCKCLKPSVRYYSNKYITRPTLADIHYKTGMETHFFVFE